jgi:hypothetical protein
MASFDSYKNNNIDYYSLEFINKEFLQVYKLTSSDIVRVVDYRCNTHYDKEGVVEFNINLFICFVQNNEYHVHHYFEDFHWHANKSFTFKLHKLFKYPYVTFGKNLVDLFFSKINDEYKNCDYLI